MRAHERRAIETQAAAWRAEAENWRKRVGDDRVVRALDSCAAELADLLRTLQATVTLLTCEQYAREHGRSASTVRRWCQAGALEAESRGGEWRIPADATPNLARLRDVHRRAHLRKVG